jgi:hypothetical protein
LEGHYEPIDVRRDGANSSANLTTLGIREVALTLQITMDIARIEEF